MGRGQGLGGGPTGASFLPTAQDASGVGRSAPLSDHGRRHRGGHRPAAGCRRSAGAVPSLRGMDREADTVRWVRQNWFPGSPGWGNAKNMFSGGFRGSGFQKCPPLPPMLAQNGENAENREKLPDAVPIKKITICFALSVLLPVLVLLKISVFGAILTLPGPPACCCFACS